jgi:hypothetical protein
MLFCCRLSRFLKLYCLPSNYCGRSFRSCNKSAGTIYTFIVVQILILWSSLKYATCIELSLAWFCSQQTETQEDWRVTVYLVHIRSWRRWRKHIWSSRKLQLTSRYDTVLLSTNTELRSKRGNYGGLSIFLRCISVYSEYKSTSVYFNIGYLEYVESKFELIFTWNSHVCLILMRSSAQKNRNFRRNGQLYILSPCILLAPVSNASTERFHGLPVHFQSNAAVISIKLAMNASFHNLFTWSYWSRPLHKGPSGCGITDELVKSLEACINNAASLCYTAPTFIMNEWRKMEQAEEWVKQSCLLCAMDVCSCELCRIRRVKTASEDWIN